MSLLYCIIIIILPALNFVADLLVVLWSLQADSVAVAASVVAEMSCSVAVELGRVSHFVAAGPSLVRYLAVPS